MLRSKLIFNAFCLVPIDFKAVVIDELDLIC